MNASGCVARIDRRAPISKTSRASRRVEEGVWAVGVKAFSLRRVSLAFERRAGISA